MITKLQNQILLAAHERKPFNRSIGNWGLPPFSPIASLSFQFGPIDRANAPIRWNFGRYFKAGRVLPLFQCWGIIRNSHMGVRGNQGKDNGKRSHSFRIPPDRAAR